MIDILIEKLECPNRLSEDEMVVLRALPVERRRVEAGKLAVAEGDLPASSLLLVSGMVGRFGLLRARPR